MSKKSLVTINQAEAVRRMANEKGVSRDAWQGAMDNGDFSKFLDNLKSGTLGIVPPPGARIYVVRVRYSPKRDWQDAINAAGPNTPVSYNVWEVGDQYPSSDEEEIGKDIILLNYPSGNGGWDKANDWAKNVGLKRTCPRQVFVVGERHPNLHKQLGCNPMYVVATEECLFVGRRDACCVWWRDSRRGADLSWIEDFDGSNGWFAFSK